MEESDCVYCGHYAELHYFIEQVSEGFLFKIRSVFCVKCASAKRTLTVMCFKHNIIDTAGIAMLEEMEKDT